MKQKLYFVALLCATLFGFTSCLSDSDDDDDNNNNNNNNAIGGDGGGFDM